MHEKPERPAAVGINEIEKFGAFFVHLPGAVGFEAKKLADAERSLAFCEVLRRNVVAREVFVGDVDAAECCIFVDIANDVGELEGQTEFFREIESAGIAETENVGAG